MREVHFPFLQISTKEVQTMHGDDVASAGVSMTTDMISKATEIFMELLKLAIERERNERLNSDKESKGLSGGEVTYQRLKEGGEVTMLPSFAREDYGELLKRAKKMDIPVAAIQEQGKENTLSVFFNVRTNPRSMRLCRILYVKICGSRSRLNA